MAPKANKECSDDLDGSSDSGPTRVYAPSDPQRLCVVCGACASGRHFGAYTCESCKLFFLRLTQGKNARPLKCGNDERCNLESRLRSVCRLCRYKKCIESGMSKDRIVYGRNARSSQKYSTPRKQSKYKLALLLLSMGFLIMLLLSYPCQKQDCCNRVLDFFRKESRSN